ncbi:hypothetical protein BC833DRAFT_267617 [Globomyces pollinis-pini]|nr:hypothetical protein BC833DRAFT_267617 [Globomyces pollinis-pini]
MTENNTKNAWQEVETAERIISESHAQRAKRQIVLTDSEVSESHSDTNMSEIQSVSKPTLKEVKSNLNVASTKRNLKENNVNQSDSCDDESDHSNHSLSELLNNLYKAKQKLSINVLHQKERKIHQGKELIETLIEQSGRAKQLDEEQQRISNMLEAILEPFNMKKSIKDNKKEHLSTGNLADLNTNLKQYLIKSEVKVTDSKSALSPARVGRNHTSPERSNREDTDLKSRSVQESFVKSLKSLETNQSISSIEEDIPFHQSNASISEDLDFKSEDSVSDIGFNIGVNAPANHKSPATDSKMPIDNSAFEPPELIEEIIETLPEDIEEELEYYNTDSFENITSISEAITKPNSTKPKDKTNKESSHLENKIADLKIEVKSTKIADAKANQSSNINTVVPISVINQESKIKIAVLEPTTNETKITKSQILDDKGQSKRQLNQQNAATSLLEKKQLTEVAAVESLQNIQFSSQSDAQKLLVAQPISSDNHIGILSISAAKVESLPVYIPEDGNN